MRITVQSQLNLLALSYAWNKTAILDSYKKKGHFSLFLLEAISRSPLPAFAYRGRMHPLQKDKKWYGDFAEDQRAFYINHKSDISVKYKKGNLKEVAHFPKKLDELLKTFGKYSPPCSLVVLSPNVFGIPGEGYGPLLGKTAYAIFTPNPKKDQTWLMVHEVCHSLLLPIFQSKEIKKLIKQTEPLMEKWSTKKFRQYYPKWEWMIEEYMIHAIEQHVTNSSIKEKMSWGMKRLPWFVSSWADFQKKRQSHPALSVGEWVKETLRTLERQM